MAKSKEQIIDEITEHFKGYAYSNCYVGITEDAKDRLFNEHNVSKENGHWIYRTANSEKIAREIEQHFLDAGMDGGGGGGTGNSNIVYAYKKTSETKE
jgi:hypothetical protein